MAHENPAASLGGLSFSVCAIGVGLTGYLRVTWEVLLYLVLFQPQACYRNAQQGKTAALHLHSCQRRPVTAHGMQTWWRDSTELHSMSEGPSFRYKAFIFLWNLVKKLRPLC